MLLVKIPRSGKVRNHLRGSTRTTFSHCTLSIAIVLKTDANYACAFVDLDGCLTQLRMDFALQGADQRQHERLVGCGAMHVIRFITSSSARG
jgi:hypothetical protein